METVRKTYYDPMATTAAEIGEILKDLPVGSAHPYSPEKVLVCQTEDGVKKIDISEHAEEFFFNAVDLGEMGEVLLRRMAGFPALKCFEEFQIAQAPASTFRIPIVSDQITILAVSERTLTYYDFCFADEGCNTSCWTARDTFPGISHSGDNVCGSDLLQYLKINPERLTSQDICVFISGYRSTKITRFLGTHPALLVADHVDKTLYIVPVPLDAATIGDATICCPLVIRADGNSLICSILPTATTDVNMCCSSTTLKSDAFPEAIKRANFTIEERAAPTELQTTEAAASTTQNAGISESTVDKKKIVFTTHSVSLPKCLDIPNSQIVHFGKSLEFQKDGQDAFTGDDSSTVILPCVFGSVLEGPLLLATGRVPASLPFADAKALQAYYASATSAVFIVNDKMTDNCRNVAPSLRMNGVFVVQLHPGKHPKDEEAILETLNSANINVVTALAGPQSLVLVQIKDTFYFYRGLANRTHLDTTGLNFGHDVTSIVNSVGLEALLDTRVPRIVDLDADNTVILATSGQFVKPKALFDAFEGLSIEETEAVTKDIQSAAPQIQVLFNQATLQSLLSGLVDQLTAKVNAASEEYRTAYMNFMINEFNSGDQDLLKQRAALLGDLKKSIKKARVAMEPVISCVANIISVRATSKRTHDLARLARHNKIYSNVEATKNMTFETLGGYLEDHASDMGVMLLNIETGPYKTLLNDLNNPTINTEDCCTLDSRVLYLEGMDAGIVMEQSQAQHSGPLASTGGISQPIMALPYLNQGAGEGSMIAWVCWDEFVNLESPYTVRWMEKCNDGHIAALRIIMRSTLSKAIASRELQLEPASPQVGALMSSLLMAAMTKLAATKSTIPSVVAQADDTTTRLMRGLFGNLLTIAGSGVRPQSMVWQLLGQESNFDLPSTNIDWSWYEAVLRLFPYTAWDPARLHENLGRFMDKLIVRVVTKGEELSAVNTTLLTDIIEFCRLRNVVLFHSRTIVTIMQKMLTDPEADTAAIATRLLQHLPPTLNRETRQYKRMIQYMNRLAAGGSRNQDDDADLANAYTRRSAVFSELKNQAAAACLRMDWDEAKAACSAILAKHAEIAALWGIDPKRLLLQNITAHRGVVDGEFAEETDAEADIEQRRQEIYYTRQVIGDAERKRQPWQVGREGEFSPKIEPLDEDFILAILTGEENEVDTPEIGQELVVATEKTDDNENKVVKVSDGFEEYKDVLRPSFVKKMQAETMTTADVCEILHISEPAMRQVVKTLNPEFDWDNLGMNLKKVVLTLLKNRSARIESQPVKQLLDMESVKLITET